MGEMLPIDLENYFKYAKTYANFNRVDVSWGLYVAIETEPL